MRAEEVYVIEKPTSKNSWEFRPGSPIGPEQHLACQETRRGWRQASFLRFPFLAALLVFILAGCAPASSAVMVMPVTGAAGAAAGTVDAVPVEVREYALVEQSKDNPTHLGFQQRVPAAIAAQRGGWGLVKVDGLAEYNSALEPFGFRLEASTSAPFSGYTLLHHEQPVQHEIGRVWPVSLREAAGIADFELPFMTLSGEKLVASQSGVQPWPGQGSAPADRHGQIAYAQTGAGVPGGAGIVSASPDVNLDEVFGQQVIDGQPLYFFTRSGFTQVHYGEKDLPYSYDMVVHDNSGALAIYNPGSTGRVVWFYALRDGLWYYVEVGKFE